MTTLEEDSLSCQNWRASPKLEKVPYDMDDL